MALNSDGTLLATASDKGTLIRIHNTFDATLVQEVRRGSDKAEIYSISFDQTSRFIASTSDKGTCHIFAIKKSPVPLQMSNEDEEDSKI